MKLRRPSDPSGNLYYVRLTTPLGKLYKLGYTKLPSVHERLAFSGRDDEKLIDTVLFFGHFADAYDMEQFLHGHFTTKAAFDQRAPRSYAPLFKNGQSELYFEDVLGFDADFSETQEREGRSRLDALRKQHEHTPATEKTLLHWLAIPLVGLLLALAWIVSIVDRLIDPTKSRAARRRSRDLELSRQDAQRHRYEATLERIRKARKQALTDADAMTQLVGKTTTLPRAFNESWQAPEIDQATHDRVQKLKHDAQLSDDLKAKVENTLSIFRNKDEEGLMVHVDLEASILNFATAIQQAWSQEKDAEDFSSALSGEDSAEVYRWLFRRFLRYGKYAVFRGDKHPVSPEDGDPAEAMEWSRVGHRLYKELGGDGAPLHLAKVLRGPGGAIDLKLWVHDKATCFQADLIVRVRLAGDGRLLLSFPNLATVFQKRRANNQLWKPQIID